MGCYKTNSLRRAALARWMIVLVIFAITIGLVGFGEVCHLVYVRSKIQVTADAIAKRAGNTIGKPDEQFTSEGIDIANDEVDKLHVEKGSLKIDGVYIEEGIWDQSVRQFKKATVSSNAVRVSVEIDKPWWFTQKLFPSATFGTSATAIGAARPRDIVFVVDVSGRMNDESTPSSFDHSCTALTGSKHPRKNYGAICRDLGFDLGFHRNEYPGQSLKGVSIESDGIYAYAQLTANGGPLSRDDVPDRYRISTSDSEQDRRENAYSWIIDNQLARLMPDARPVPDSKLHFDYWARYLDYIIRPTEIFLPVDEHWFPNKKFTELSPIEQNDMRLANRGASHNRGLLPPRESDRIFERMTRENTSEHSRLHNLLGYRSYVQFLLDHGRDLKVIGDQYSPLSIHHPSCPLHTEQTPAGQMKFPPRAEPMHSVRRSLVAAITQIKQRNRLIPEAQHRDWISVITYDSLSGGSPNLVAPLSPNYNLAITASTRLQAAGDEGPARPIDAALHLAATHIESHAEGGQGRQYADKVIVLITGSDPEQHVTPDEDIAKFVLNHEKPDAFFVTEGKRGLYIGPPELNGPLVVAESLRRRGWKLFVVDVKQRFENESWSKSFPNTFARIAGTADPQGDAMRRGMDPSKCEQEVTGHLLRIINSPRIEIVQ